MAIPDNADGEEKEVVSLTAAEEAAVQQQLAVDEDGDGIPDVAGPLMLMVDADGDGISDGLHADKLGMFVPQAGLMNGRPTYVNSSNAELVLWWSSGRWYLGKHNELGRNRGWLKAIGDGAIPPETGWLVYSKPEKVWVEMEGMVAKPAGGGRVEAALAALEEPPSELPSRTPLIAEAHANDGTIEVHINRTALVPVGFRLYTDTGLDARRLWGMKGIRLQAGRSSEACPQRPVVAWTSMDGLARRAGLLQHHVILAMNEVVDPSHMEVRERMHTLLGEIVLVVKPLDLVLEQSKLQPTPRQASGADWGLMPNWDSSPRPGVPSTKPQPGSVAASPRPPRSTRREPVVPPKIDAHGQPLTARGMKSAMQLHKELKEVGQTMHHMRKRVEQALSFTRGTRLQLLRSAESTMKIIQNNPSLTLNPSSPEAYALAADEVREIKVREEYFRQYGVEPSEDAFKVELQLATGKLVRRHTEAVKLVQEALSELQEIAELGAESLASHEENLRKFLEIILPEHEQDLRAHFNARERVVKTTNRFEADHLVDEATHDCLRLATESECLARYTLNRALKAARRERSVLEACKADLQRAAQQKHRVLEKHKHDDLRGTTFLSWNQMDLTEGWNT